MVTFLIPPPPEPTNSSSLSGCVLKPLITILLFKFYGDLFGEFPFSINFLCGWFPKPFKWGNNFILDMTTGCDWHWMLWWKC